MNKAEVEAMLTGIIFDKFVMDAVVIENCETMTVALSPYHLDYFACCGAHMWESLDVTVNPIENAVSLDAFDRLHVRSETINWYLAASFIACFTVMTHEQRGQLLKLTDLLNRTYELYDPFAKLEGLGFNFNELYREAHRRVTIMKDMRTIPEE